MQPATTMDIVTVRRSQSSRLSPSRIKPSATQLHASRPKPAAHEAHARPARIPRTNHKAPLKFVPNILKPSRLQLLYAMAMIVFVFGMAVGLNGIRLNRLVAAQIRTSQIASENTAGQDGIQTTGPAPSHATAPSSAKLSAASLANYTVSPTMPRYLDIAKLGIHARVLSEGVDKNGVLQVPWNIYDTGWYNSSVQPGQPGAMLIDGHSGIDGMKGSFYKLPTLSTGDPIVITRGDGHTYTYVVQKVAVVGVADVDMKSMVTSIDPSKPGLNLITCTGERIPGTDQLNKRVEVYATLQ